MSPNTYTLTPSQWDALDRLCDTYQVGRPHVTVTRKKERRA